LSQGKTKPFNHKDTKERKGAQVHANLEQQGSTLRQIRMDWDAPL